MKRDVFQAIADPTRRALISLIGMGAMTPNAMAEHFDMTRQAVSKHLQILVECDLVKTKQDGREIYYQLQPKKMKIIADFIEPYRQMWDTRYNQLDQVLLNIKKQRK